MSRVAAFVVLGLLAGGQHATAQTASVINLSCDGKVKKADGKVEPVTNMGLVVNLAQNTVAGFGAFGLPFAHIKRVDDLNVDFDGKNDWGDGSFSVNGGIDRVTGAAWAVGILTGKDNKIMATEAFDLVCKVTSRLF